MQESPAAKEEQTNSAALNYLPLLGFTALAWPPLQILVVKELFEIALEIMFENAGTKLRKCQ